MMAGAVLSIGLVACTATLTVGLVTAGGAAMYSQHLAGIADAAALAAADAASGAITGAPCDRAAEIASVAGTRVGSCQVDALIATVVVEGLFGILPAHASARAGPPP